MRSQADRAAAFRALHDRPGAFVIPNPWDAGSATVLAGSGFEALATTSAGLAYTLGKPDGAATREETLANARAIVEATDLPVSADLGSCFGAAPEACAETIRLAAEAGVVGGSVEDYTGRNGDPLHPLALAVERVTAAVRAARALPFPFVLTARTERQIETDADFADVVRRLEAFAAAGADVLFASGLRTLEQVATVVRAVAPKPVNVIMGFGGTGFTMEQLGRLGVKRVSLGSSLARAAWGAVLRAAEEIRGRGTFGYTQDAPSFGDKNARMRGRA